MASPLGYSLSGAAIRHNPLLPMLVKGSHGPVGRALANRQPRLFVT
jgi:hypothetical protein